MNPNAPPSSFQMFFINLGHSLFSNIWSWWAAGLGIGLLPDFSAESPLMVPLLPDWRPVGFFGERIYAVRPGGVRASRAVECALEHLRQVFA